MSKEDKASGRAQDREKASLGQQSLGTGTGQGAGSQAPFQVAAAKALPLSGHRCLLSTSGARPQDSEGTSNRMCVRPSCSAQRFAVKQRTCIFIFTGPTDYIPGLAPQPRRSIFFPVSSPLEKPSWGGEQEGGLRGLASWLLKATCREEVGPA